MYSLTQSLLLYELSISLPVLNIKLQVIFRMLSTSKLKRPPCFIARDNDAVFNGFLSDTRINYMRS